MANLYPEEWAICGIGGCVRFRYGDAVGRLNLSERSLCILVLIYPLRDNAGLCTQPIGLLSLCTKKYASVGPASSEFPQNFAAIVTKF